MDTESLLRYSHLADRVLAAAVEVLPALQANGSASQAEGGRSIDTFLDTWA